MAEAYLCEGLRTPIGRYAGALSSVRPDDLGTVPIKALMARNEKADWSRLDDIRARATQRGADRAEEVDLLTEVLRGPLGKVFSSEEARSTIFS